MEIEMYKINEGDDYVSLSAFFYENGLEVKPKIEKPERAVGFKLSEGMDVPKELEGKFKFSRMKSKLAG